MVGVYGPIRIKSPSRVHGSVYVWGDDEEPAEGAQVILAPIPGTQVIERTWDSMTKEEKVSTTHGDGYYYFEKVIPGDYVVYVVGSDKYAAVGNPSDDFGGTDPPGVFTVELNDDAIRPPYQTVEKGTFVGEIRGVVWNGAEFEPGEPAADFPVPIFNDLYVYPDDFGDRPQTKVRGQRDPLMWAGSSYYKRFVKDQELSRIPHRNKNLKSADGELLRTDSNGKFVLEHFGPKIVQIDESDPARANVDKQYTMVEMEYETGFKSTPPFTPILIKPTPNWKNPKMWVFNGRNFTEFPGENRGKKDGREVYPFGEGNDEGQFYVLQRKALGNMRGNIVYEGNGQNGGNNEIFEFPGTIYTTITNGQGGLGAVVEEDGNLVHKGRYFIRTNPDANPNYDFADALGNFVLPPNLRNENTRFTFETDSEDLPLIDDSRPFEGLVRLYENVLENGVVITRRVPKEETDVTFSLREKTGLWQTNVNVQDGEFYLDGQRVQYAEIHKAELTEPISPCISPLECDVLEMNFEVKRNQGFKYENYDLRAIEDSTWSPFYGKDVAPTTSFVWNDLNRPDEDGDGIRDGIYQGFIYLARKSRTGRIYGKVLNEDLDNQPILGQLVYMKPSGPEDGNYEEQSFVTVEDACPSCDGGPYQFVFDNVLFHNWHEDNIVVRTQAEGFEEQIIGERFVEGMDKEMTFIFRTPPSEFVPPDGDL